MVSLPPSLTTVVLFTNVLLAALVVAGTVRAARLAGLAPGVRRRLGLAVAAVLAAWFGVAALVASAALSPLDPRVLGLIGAPVVLGSLATLSGTWRRFVRAVPQAWLVGAQTYRVIGAVFLAVWAAGGLPAYFAIPAGVGDILTGLGALAVAGLIVRRHRGWRGAAVGWNLFGLADLVVAVGAGSTLLAGPLSAVFAAEITTAAVVAFPLGTIPMFLVPISVLLHLYSLGGLLAGSAGRGTGQPDRTAIR